MKHCFNASLLKDIAYIDKLKQCFTDSNVKYQNELNLSLKWDLIKMEMRSLTISFSKNKARETRETINKLIIQIDKLEKEINNNPTDEILKEYNEGKKYIEQHNNEKTQASQIRSKVNWTEFGEK